MYLFSLISATSTRRILRQTDHERRSLRRGVDPDRSTVGNDDLMDNRKPQSGATFLGRIKWQENLVPDILVDAMAGIRNGNQHLMIIA